MKNDKPDHVPMPGVRCNTKIRPGLAALHNKQGEGGLSVIGCKKNLRRQIQSGIAAAAHYDNYQT